jgi:5-methylcytosine-specific restriction endonuclease McrA
MADRPGRPRLDPGECVDVHLTLPSNVYDAAYRLAKSEGISIPELVRSSMAIEAMTAQDPSITTAQAFRIVRQRRLSDRHARRASQIASMSASHARRARRLQDGFVEEVNRLVVFARHNGICGICMKPVCRDEFAVDHIVPLAKGGQHSYANTQPAHRRCNSKKHARIGFSLQENGDV